MRARHGSCLPRRRRDGLRRRRGPSGGHALAALILLLVAAPPSTDAAQPAIPGASRDGVDEARSAETYIAGYGFSRPVQIAAVEGGTSAALAFDGELPVVYWYDGDAVSRRPASGSTTPTTLADVRGTRDLAAVTVGGEPALLRVTRDFGTGQNAHVIAWGGASRTVASTLQVQPVALAAAGDGPAWAVRGPAGERTALRVGAWTRDPVVVRESGESIAGYSLSAAPDGALWIAWLEGSTDQTALGAQSDWRAFLARVTFEGAVQGPLELGSAVSRGELDATRVTAAADGVVHVLWPREDGRLVATTLQTNASGWPAADPGSADDGADARTADDETVDDGSAGDGALRLDRILGEGLPVGVLHHAAYWADGDRVRRMALETGAEVETVLWAPNTILGIAAATGPGDRLVLAWQGGTLGGGSAVYAANTAEPFVPGVRDHLAARMGWNPWNVWTEALGQVLAALLAGTMLTMALTPVLWLAAAVTVRFGSPGSGTLAGIAIGGATVAGVLFVARVGTILPAATAASLFGGGWQIVAALGLGGLITWTFRRRADSEPLLGTLVSAAACAGVAIAVLSFVTFQAWSGAFTGLL